jgi:alcohol oxidase
MPVKAGKAPEPSMLNSNQQEVREDLQYSEEDLHHVEEWVKVSCSMHQTRKWCSADVT